jgi:hypothetical protein
MLSKLQLTACLGLFLCSSIHSASAATKQIPIGQPTTFDAGIDSDGHKTYMVHGYVNVNHVNSHNATKTFDGVIRSPISDLAIDHVQADLIVSGFSGAPNVGSVIFTKITPDDATGDVAYSLAIRGHSSVTQIHYTLFIGTAAVSPWPPRPGSSRRNGGRRRWNEDLWSAKTREFTRQPGRRVTRNGRPAIC